jgi:hypothetical protein
VIDDQTRADLTRLAEQLEADAVRAEERADLVAAILARNIPEPEPEPVPEPVPPVARLVDVVGPDRLLVAGPAHLPPGRIQRTGAAGDHNGAPDMRPFYDTAGGWFPGPNTRGTAPVEGVSPDELRIILAAADWHAKDGGGTGMHHQWHYTRTPHLDLTVEFWQLFETPELGWTGKAMGFGTFSGDWPLKWTDFPAGGMRPQHTCLVRSAHTKFQHEDYARARLIEIIKTGRKIDQSKVFTADGSLGRGWYGAEGTVQADYSFSPVNDLLGRPPIGVWIGTRYVAHWGATGRPNGSLHTYTAVVDEAGSVDLPWTLATRVEGIDWVQSDGPDGPGFNMVYQSWMYGGNTIEYAPANPTRTGVRRFRDLAVVSGLVLP